MKIAFVILSYRYAHNKFQKVDIFLVADKKFSKKNPTRFLPLSDGGYVRLCGIVCSSGTSKLICKVINWYNWNVFILIQILTEYIGIEPRVSVCLSVCVSLCLSVCLSMCVISTPKRMVRFLRNLKKKRSVFSDFENSKLMTSWRQFCTFSLGHSKGRNFAPIFFKIAWEVESCLPLFLFKISEIGW